MWNSRKHCRSRAEAAGFRSASSRPHPSIRSFARASPSPTPFLSPVSLTECAIACPIPRASASARPPPWASRVESRYISSHSTSRNRFLSPRLPPRAATLRARSRLSILHPLASHPNSSHPNPTRPIPSDQSSPSPSAHVFADISHRWTSNYWPGSCFSLSLSSRSSFLSLCRNFDFLESLKILSLSHSSLLAGCFILVN